MPEPATRVRRATGRALRGQVGAVLRDLRGRSFGVDRRLLWAKPDSSWKWLLTPHGRGGTRLLTRIRAVYEWKTRPLMPLFGCVLMEFGDFAMLRGIKARAGTHSQADLAIEVRP